MVTTLLNPVGLYFYSSIKLHKSKEKEEDTVKDMNVERYRRLFGIS